MIPVLRRLCSVLACLATLGVLVVAPPAGSAAAVAEGSEGVAGTEGDTDDVPPGTRGLNNMTNPGVQTAVERGSLSFGVEGHLGSVVGGYAYLQRWVDTATNPWPACERDEALNDLWRRGQLDHQTKWISGTLGTKRLDWSLSATDLTADRAGRYRVATWTGIGSGRHAYVCFSIYLRLHAPFVSNPQSTTVNERGTATFTSTSSSPTGTIAPSTQWQRSTDGGSTWTDISGARSTTYTVSNVTAEMHGHRYRAVHQRLATNEFQLSSDAVSTTAATLNVRAAARIAQHPSGVTVDPGQTASFSVTATGQAPLTYQWQRSTDGGSTWTDLTGQTGASLTVEGATAEMDGHRFQVRVNNVVGVPATSEAAVLTVRQPPVITAQPEPRTVTAGETAEFAVAAEGTGDLGVQWHRSSDGGETWTPLDGQTGWSMTTSPTTIAMSGWLYRAEVTDPALAGAAGSVTSEPATLTVRPRVTIQVTVTPRVVLVDRLPAWEAAP